MSSSRKKRKKTRIILIIVSFFLFAIGYYLLNVVSTIYRVVLGGTFYVVLGCSLMAISAVYTGYAINKIFFTKKKKRSRPIFLEDNPKDAKS